jgi:hypothetical protein
MTSGRVLPNERKGVFVHAFKCRQCGLEFQLFSWLRHCHCVGGSLSGARREDADASLAHLCQ